jgi:hypothetical protein
LSSNPEMPVTFSDIVRDEACAGSQQPKAFFE